MRHYGGGEDCGRGVHDYHLQLHWQQGPGAIPVFREGGFPPAWSLPLPSLLRPLGRCLNDEAGGNEETVLLAARSCVDDHPLDQSDHFDELAMENLDECSGKRATASLRRQMELFIESAAQGKLHANSVLVLTLQLVSQIPGFDVGGVVRASFANLPETRSALQGAIQFLQSTNLPATYDAGKGVMLLTEALTRLTTFKYLYGSLACFEEELGAAADIARTVVEMANPLAIDLLLPAFLRGLCVSANRRKGDPEHVQGLRREDPPAGRRMAAWRAYRGFFVQHRDADAGASARAALQRRRGGCAPRWSSPRSLLKLELFSRETMQASCDLKRRTSQDRRTSQLRLVTLLSLCTRRIPS